MGEQTITQFILLVFNLALIGLAVILWTQIKDMKTNIKDLYNKNEQLKDLVHSEVSSMKNNYIHQFKDVRDDIGDLKLNMNKEFSELKLQIGGKVLQLENDISNIERNCASKICEKKEI